MAVLAYVGLPGSGKSYSAVAHSIVPALQEGRPVVTNMPLDSAALAVHLDSSPDVRCLPESPEGWAELPKGALIVIDEAWRWWPSGQRANKMPEAEREFFAMHRHQVDTEGRSQQIVLVSQGLNQLNAFVKNLVESTFVTKKLNQVGAAGKYRVDVYDGTQLTQERMIRQIFGEYSPEVWQFYKSHTAAQGPVDQVNEKTLDKRASLLKSWAVSFGIPAGVVGLVIAGWLAVHTLQGIGGAEAAEPAPARAPVAAREAGAALPAPQPEALAAVTTWSNHWRLAAEIQWQDGHGALCYVEGLGGLRRIPCKACMSIDGDTVCDVDGEKVTRWSGPDSIRRVAVADKIK